MKVCPYCREEIKDEAIKCRYCQSVLVPLPGAPSAAETPSDRVTYILDRDLVRFAKFAGAVLSVMVVVGLILFGIDLKNMQEKMSKTQEEMNKSKEEMSKSVQEGRALHAQMAELSPKLEKALAEVEANRQKAAEGAQSIEATVKSVSFIGVQLSQTLARNQGGLSHTGAPGSSGWPIYKRAEVQAFLVRDTAKARQFFESLGLHPPAIPTKIDPDASLLNTYWDGKTVVFGMGMVNSKIFGPYDPRLVYHESCHSLFDIQFQGQSGSVSESICDVLAVVLDGSDWNIGFVKTSDPAKPAHLRSLQDPGSAYDSPQLGGKDPEVGHMSQFKDVTQDGGGVHINVGIVNKAAYLISEGGTFHGVTVSAGIGREKLAKLYTAAIRKLSKGSNVSFQQWRGLLMGEAENLFGKDSPETKAVEAAFRAVGIA